MGIMDFVEKKIAQVGEIDPKKMEAYNQKIPNPIVNDKEVSKILGNFKNIVKSNEKGYGLNLADLNKYDNVNNELNKIKQSTSDEKLKSEIDETIKYINTVKETTQINEEFIENTNKTVIQFKRIADMCRSLILILTVICIIIFMIVLIISFFNVINLFMKIGISIISLFYNSVITNNQTISYSAKQIIKCSKNNFTHDMFNILNEQSTSLSVFNTSIYIIYILLFYVIIYLLVLVFVNIYQYTHVLKGELKDIDPKLQLLTIIGLIFICSLIHLLIYKFFFRKLSFNKFKDINNYEKSIDNLIEYNLSPINKDYDNNFFDLLTDSTKRNEIDNIFSKKVDEVDQQPNDLSKYLIMYDIYMYFDEYVYMNDVVKEDLRNYFKLGEEDASNKTFISFLDANQRKLIKLYHEELPFYKQIPPNKLEAFQKINEKVSQTIGNINKSIIKYTGTFFPFLFACIYIIGIFIFNAICAYILMDYILTTTDDNILPSFIYTIAIKYKMLMDYIYNIFKV
jgi:hypothetical protein